MDAFRQGLRALGYVEDQTIALEIRWDEGDPGRWPDLAAELVVRNVDILVAGSGSAAQATKRTTTTMPIVMLVGVDPVAQGLVTSLTHPGGNITGLTVTTTAMTQKRLELLKEAGPSLSRVAVLWGGSQPPEHRLAARSWSCKPLGAQPTRWGCSWCRWRCMGSTTLTTSLRQPQGRVSRPCSQDSSRFSLRTGYAWRR